MIEKGSKIKYLGEDTSVLEHGEEYTVFEVFENGIRIYIPTGFAGLTDDKFEVIK